MTKQEKIESFDPSGVGLDNGNLFGFPFTLEESNYIVVPVPWDVTVSFGHGTSNAASSILEASSQLDFHFPDFPDLWKEGIAMVEIPEELKLKSEHFRILAEAHIEALEKGDLVDEERLNSINEACSQMNDWVESTVSALRSEGKEVVLLGGDHSTPLGSLRSLKSEEFAVLTIDAHLDLRVAYEGFTYSHASVMYNAFTEGLMKQLVSVGVRDYCNDEVVFVKEQRGKIQLFPDQVISEALFEGHTWRTVVANIVEKLPKNVYVSIDIDGLSPELCPNTGTPVPGGLSFNQLIYLLKALVVNEKVIIGADLVEVGASEWDANVGARVLYNLLGYMHLSKTHNASS